MVIGQCALESVLPDLTFDLFTRWLGHYNFVQAITRKCSILNIYFTEILKLYHLHQKDNKLSHVDRRRLNYDIEAN